MTAYPLLAERALTRAAEAISDASEQIRAELHADASALIREALGNLDAAEKHL